MKKNISRVKNTLYNFITSMGSQLITIIMSFICRTVFIHTLGESFLGINGLFENILSMLSLAELGVGTAILYRLYEPLAEHNIPKIQAWINLLKIAYRIIALIILAIGLFLIPFLPLLINDYDKLSGLGINVVLVFCLFLLKTISTYMFFAYRCAIIKADQKQYVLTIVNYIIIIGTKILQIVSLVILKNFIVYIAIATTMLIVENLLYAMISQKLYPYISNKNVEKISKNELKETIKDCFALFLYRLNSIVLKSTDNIVLSIFKGLSAVAVYSNYLILYNTINAVFFRVFDSMVHSVGNLHTTKKHEHEYLVFKATIFIAIVLGSTAAIGIYIVADELVHTWIGEKWIISQPFSLLMGFELFTVSICTALSKFRNALGLFQHSKYRPIFSALVNVVASVVLVQYCGICGVILGTIIAYWTTFLVFDPIVLHKFGFNGKYKVQSFYFQILSNLLIVALTGFVLKFVCLYVYPSNGWTSVLIHMIICAVSTPFVLLVTNWKKEETRYLMSFLKKVKP